MMDEHDLYPAQMRRRVALFQRNPVCALCFDLCSKKCRNYRSVEFDLMNCLEEADLLAEQIILNPYDLDGVEQYYNRLRNHYNGDKLSVSCVIVTLCTIFNCIEDLPDSIRELSTQLEGLLSGPGFDLYESLTGAACHLGIELTVSSFGAPPPAPPVVLENEQLRSRNTLLEQQIANYKKQISTMQPTIATQINGNVYKDCTFATTTNNTTNNNYYGGAPLSGAPGVRPEHDPLSAAPRDSAEIPLFRFIHPSVTDETERIQIHREVVNLVTHLPLPEVCRYLQQMKHDNRVFLCSKPETMFDELHRLGLPPESVPGFSKKNFMNYYNIND